jgi:hypothetical protein
MVWMSESELIWNTETITGNEGEWKKPGAHHAFDG